MAGQGVARLDSQRLSKVERTSDEALRIASEALTRLEGHEQRCGDRYEAIQISNSETKAALTRIHERIDEVSAQVSGRWFYVGSSIIGLLIGIIGYLLKYGAPGQ